MFDIGWSEMAIVAVDALFVIGPRDLPKALRTVGRYAGKLRAMAREFQSSIDEAVREAELDEVKKQIESVAKLDVPKSISNAIDPEGEIGKGMDFTQIGETPSEPKKDDEAAGKGEPPGAAPTPALPAAGAGEEGAGAEKDGEAADAPTDAPTAERTPSAVWPSMTSKTPVPIADGAAKMARAARAEAEAAAAEAAEAAAPEPAAADSEPAAPPKQAHPDN